MECNGNEFCFNYDASSPMCPSIFDLDKLGALSAGEREEHVIIIQAPFPSDYEAEVVEDFIAFARSLGKKPVLLPFKPNGKAQHIKGFLKQFAATAQSSGAFLSQVARLNIPMVGLDPALVLCYRDEYSEILEKDRGGFEVLMVHEWLLPRLDQFEKRDHRRSDPWYLLAHCAEKTKLPKIEAYWITVFDYFGATLQPVAVGCCGMAGTFGHEADKLQMSKDIYGLSWKPVLDELPKERVLVTGYSCRSQVKRLEGIHPKHPLQALLEHIG